MVHEYEKKFILTNLEGNNCKIFVYISSGYFTDYLSSL